MKKWLSGIGLFLLSTSFSVAQTFSVRAVEVDSAGAVLLRWSREASFFSGSTLEVWSAWKREGPYQRVGSVIDTTGRYYHADAAGDKAQRFYCLSGSAAKSDTVSTLFMGMENRGGGIAVLAWTNPKPDINTICRFTLYRRGFGNDSVTTLSRLDYEDTVTVCGDTLKYVLYGEIAGMFRYVSPVCKDYFYDYTAPDTVRLDSVSLHPRYHYAELGWQPSVSADVYGYITYIYRDGIWQAMDTLYGAESCHYIDSVYADGNVWQYRVAAMDTCRNVSPLGEIHHNLKLSSVPSKCDSSVRLSWNSYSHLPGGVASFEVFASRNGEAFTCIGVEQGGATSYTCRHLDVMAPYRFYVRVWNADRTASSTSSIDSVAFHRVLGHGKSFVRSVSVGEDRCLEISAYVPDSVRFNQLVLWRQTPEDSLFLPTDTADKAGDSYSWRHCRLAVDGSVYAYRVSLTDECGMPFATSVVAKNILLRISRGENDEYVLDWTAYEGFDRHPDDYAIYRRSDSASAWELLSVNPPQSLTYKDAVRDAVLYEYRVAARGSHQELPFEEVCYSNIVSFGQEPISYVPNSFVPSSVIASNRVFKPVLLYVDAAEYTLTIFDRWGQVVFETHHPDEGWDGNIKGKPARAGVYVYQMTYRLNEKKLFTQRGMVNLIR